MSWGFCAGPRLFAVPGDVLEIVFRNNLNTSTNIVPSGVITNTTAAAEPGQTAFYEWKVGEEVCTCPHRQACMRSSAGIFLGNCNRTHDMPLWAVIATSRAE